MVKDNIQQFTPSDRYSAACPPPAGRSLAAGDPWTLGAMNA